MTEKQRVAKRKFGSYRAVSNGRWELRYPTVGENGLPAGRKSEYVKGTRLDCEKRLEDLRVLYEWRREHARSLHERRSNAISLDRVFYDYYVPYIEEERPIARTTFNGYRDIYRRCISPAFGRIPLDLVTHSDVQGLLDMQSWSVAKHICSVTRLLYNFAQNKGLITRNQNVMADRYRFPPNDEAHRRQRSNTKVFDEETFAAVMEAARGRKFEGVMLLMGAGGCRPAEACGVDPSLVTSKEIGGMLWALVPIVTDLVKLHGRVYEGGTKTPKSKRVALVPDPYATRLLEICGEKVRIGERYMAYDYLREIPLAARDIREMWQKWFATQPFEYIPPKNLRNTYATILFSKGVPPEAISLLLGHSSKSEMLYQHYVRPNAEQSAALLSRFLAPHSASAVPRTEPVKSSAPERGVAPMRKRSESRARKSLQDRPVADVANIRFANAPDGLRLDEGRGRVPRTTSAASSHYPTMDAVADAKEGVEIDSDIRDAVMVARVLKAMKEM